MSVGFASSGSGGQGFAIRLEADGDTKLGNSDGDLHQVTGTLQLNDNVFFLANGRVGLGDSAPGFKLTVGGSMEVGEYIYHRGDTNTFIRFQDDSVNLQAGGADFITLTEAAQDEVVINESSADIDFRVESNGQTHMLFVDGANDRVGIQTDSPTAILHISQSADSGGDTSLFRVDAYTQTNPAIDIKDNGTEAYVGINTSAGTNALTVDAHSAGALAVRATNGHIGTTQDNYGLKIGTAAKTLVHDGTDFVFDDSLKVSGDVSFDGGAVFNESSADKDFRVESNNAENMFFIDGSSNRIGIGNNSPQHTLDIQERAGVEAVIRLVGSADVGIRLAADSDNSGENDNPYIDFYQDGLNSNSRPQRLATMGMEGDAGATFTDSLANAFFLDAAYPAQLGTSTLRTLQLANDSNNNGHKARITLEGTNGYVGIHTNTPGSPLEVSGNVRLHGTTTSQFYVTEVKEQDLGSGTNSTLSVASGTMLLDADSINGFDMGGGMEVHELAFPRGNDSGTRLSLIVKSTTNSVFILPSGLISGSFDSLNDSAGVTATEYVWISEGTHQAWHQVK